MVENLTIERESYEDGRPFEGQVIGCAFRSCDFASSDLSRVAFIDCAFVDCNLAGASIRAARFQGVRFENCKLIGLDFTAAHDFGMSLEFERCNLTYALFDYKKLPRTRFIDCTLREAQFNESDLAGATFSGSELMGAVFLRSNLRGTDFRDAMFVQLDPCKKQVKGAKFRCADLAGLLTGFELTIDGD